MRVENKQDGEQSCWNTSSKKERKRHDFIKTITWIKTIPVIWTVPKSTDCNIVETGEAVCMLRITDCAVRPEVTGFKIGLADEAEDRVRR